MVEEGKINGEMYTFCDPEVEGREVYIYRYGQKISEEDWDDLVNSSDRVVAVEVDGLPYIALGASRHGEVMQILETEMGLSAEAEMRIHIILDSDKTVKKIFHLENTSNYSLIDRERFAQCILDMIPSSRISSNPRLDTGSCSKVIGSDEETFVIDTDNLKRFIQERLIKDGRFVAERIESDEKWGKSCVTRKILDFPQELVRSYP